MFKTIHSVSVSRTENNETVFAKVVELNNQLYFDLRLYKNGLPTKSGIFLDCVEFIWLSDEIKNIDRKNKLLVNNERSISINSIGSYKVISLEKVDSKTSITLKIEEVDCLIKELPIIAKFFKNESSCN